MFKRIIIVAVFSLAVMQGAIAQVLITPFNEKLLQGRVKQVEEFFSRFNLEESWDGKPIADKNDATLRRKYLRTLFDADKFSVGKGKLNATAEKFIDNVVDNGCRLHFEDSTWVAEVTCNAMLANKQQILKLSLRTRKLAPYQYCWVITNVSGPMFDIFPEETTCPVLSPVENETGFISLLTVDYSSNSFTQMFGEDYRNDKLSMLAVLLKNRLLVLKSIKEVKYHFFSIPGWSFTVVRKEKENTFNTGWLITSMNEMQ